MKRKVDVKLWTDGSMVGFRPVTDEAVQYMAENFFDEGWLWLGNIMYVELRMHEQVAAILEDAGFVLVW